jgi:hypothetical protein
MQLEVSAEKQREVACVKNCAAAEGPDALPEGVPGCRYVRRAREQGCWRGVRSQEHGRRTCVLRPALRSRAPARLACRCLEASELSLWHRNAPRPPF